jgi:hypothetical protein
MRFRLPTCTLLATFALFCAVGCQKAGVPLVPVEGKLTYGGGEWPKPGMLYFAVKEPATDMPRKPGTAILNTDGTFKAKTFVDGDGLVPGTYSVNIECWKEPPSMGPKMSQGVSYVPEKQRSGATSGFLIEVPMDAKEPIKVERDVPKT